MRVEEALCNHRFFVASMSKLLSPLSMGSESRLDLEKQVQKLREMLDESEDQVAALRAQEKVMWSCHAQDLS